MCPSTPPAVGIEEVAHHEHAMAAPMTPICVVGVSHRAYQPDLRLRITASLL